MGMIKRQIREHRTRTIAIVVAIAVVAGFGLYWFSPQSALIDRRVDEALPPAAAPTATPTPDDDQQPAETDEATAVPGVLAAGGFTGVEHETTGTAQLVELDDGRVFLRLEDFETLNGPDLRVYLSDAPADGDPAEFESTSIDLGGLKGNVGNQNYKLPDKVDASDFASAVIWCRRFAVAFGVAPLDAP